MIYAKFIDENRIEYAMNTVQVTITNVPRILEENVPLSTVLGYYPVVKSEPEPIYNPETQYLQEVYTLKDNQINVTYKVRELFE